MALELATVAEDGAVLFDGADLVRLTDLKPDTPYVHEGVAFRTLPRRGSERLASVVTVNDVHFGETVGGLIEGFDVGPVLIFGHHHIWDRSARSRPDTYFGVHPDDSERLVAVVARRTALIGYFCGHTHRNRVRRFESTGDVPWVEVACVKDFPGPWAEYRVFEGGVLQVNHRIATPDALAWSEGCRAMLGGFYPQYAFGLLADRCFPVWKR